MMLAASQLSIICRALGLPDETQQQHNSPLDIPDVRLVAIDLEKYCKENSPVTAIGVSILQTSDVQFHVPGSDGANFINAIKAYNLRPRETGHKFNKFAYFEDKPESFQFGVDEWFAMKEARQILKTVLEHDGDTILIFHGGKNDIQDIKEKLGYDVAAADKLVTIVDTQRMARQYGPCYMCNNIGLTKLTNILGINGIISHNAGNDAVATMVDALLLAIAWSRQQNPPITELPELLENTDTALQLTLERGTVSVSDSCALSTSSPESDTPPTSHSALSFVNDLVNALMERPYSESPVFGSFTHCTGCDDYDHLAAECPYWRTLALECKRCHGNEHITKLCMVKDYKLADKIKFHDSLLGPLGAREYFLR